MKKIESTDTIVAPDRSLANTLSMDESSYVRVCGPASRPTDTPAHRPTHRPAHEHISEENKNRKEIVKEKTMTWL